MLSNVLRASLLSLFVTGCCIVPPAPSAPPSSAPPSIAPSIAPPASPIANTAPTMPVAPVLDARSAFELDLSRVPQIEGLRRLFDGATPLEGPLEATVLVCSATLRNGGFDDSFFAGGADVALALRLGTGALRSTAQSSERLYSFPVRRLDIGENVWMRVLDRDVFFDDTIAEGSTTYARTPFALTMGQADVACRALDPSLVARRSAETIDALRLAVAALATPSPDVTAPDLGYPHVAVERVRTALSAASAWMDPSVPQLDDALEPARAWARAWEREAQVRVATAMHELPPPGAVTIDGDRRLSLVSVSCGVEASEIRSRIASPEDPGGCIVLLHVEGGGRLIDPGRYQADSWALDRAGTRLELTPLGLRYDGAWHRVDATSFVPATGGDVAYALPPGVDATLARLGAPLAHGVVLRLR